MAGACVMWLGGFSVRSGAGMTVRNWPHAYTVLSSVKGCIPFCLVFFPLAHVRSIFIFPCHMTRGLWKSEQLFKWLNTVTFDIFYLFLSAEDTYGHVLLCGFILFYSGVFVFSFVYLIPFDSWYIYVVLSYMVWGLDTYSNWRFLWNASRFVGISKASSHVIGLWKVLPLIDLKHCQLHIMALYWRAEECRIYSY